MSDEPQFDCSTCQDRGTVYERVGDDEWESRDCPDCPPDPFGWWCIPGSDILAALKRCAQGENPDIVYAELYANYEVEPPEI